MGSAVSFARSLALRVLSEVLTKGTSLVLMLAVARALGSARFGVFSIAWATGWLLALASDMGLHMLGAREAARGVVDIKRLAGGLPTANALLHRVALAALAIGAPLLASGTDRYVVWAVAGGLLLLSYVDLVQHLLRGR